MEADRHNLAPYTTLHPTYEASVSPMSHQPSLIVYKAYTSHRPSKDLFTTITLVLPGLLVCCCENANYNNMYCLCIVSQLCCRLITSAKSLVICVPNQGWRLDSRGCATAQTATDYTLCLWGFNKTAILGFIGSSSCLFLYLDVAWTCL